MRSRGASYNAVVRENEYRRIKSLDGSFGRKLGGAFAPVVDRTKCG
jgi:hypothetical protein